MRSDRSVEIDRPIEEVFRLTTEHVAEWSIIVIEDTVLDEKPGGVGTTFRTVTEENGKQMVFEGTVVRHEPPFVNAVEMRGQYFDIHAVYLFEDLGGRTRVTQKSEVFGKGIFKLILAVMGWMMRSASCKALDKELASLKRFCEQRISASTANQTAG
jgi:uncharacterized protein YndB with AHSA1/START domain